MRTRLVDVSNQCRPVAGIAHGLLGASTNGTQFTDLPFSSAGNERKIICPRFACHGPRPVQYTFP